VAGTPGRGTGSRFDDAAAVVLLLPSGVRLASSATSSGLRNIATSARTTVTFEVPTIRTPIRRPEHRARLRKEMLADLTEGAPEVCRGTRSACCHLDLDNDRRVTQPQPGGRCSPQRPLCVQDRAFKGRRSTRAGSDAGIPRDARTERDVAPSAMRRFCTEPATRRTRSGSAVEPVWTDASMKCLRPKPRADAPPVEDELVGILESARRHDGRVVVDQQANRHRKQGNARSARSRP